jgi:coenzyme F420-reducing hydrogenase beta subunit
MSFQLLKKEIIDQNLCLGCGICARSCKNIEMIDLIPQLISPCILDSRAKSCGNSYDLCPQVKKLKKQAVNRIFSTREVILSNVLKKGSTTISEMKTELHLPIKDVRYHALRLAQDHKLAMVLGKEEPIFSPYIEE